MRQGTLLLKAYFQRNLVWRPAHKRDFIHTILAGYPFPQIFLARGPIDLDEMRSTQCVVDGLQRLSTIRDFIEGRLIVDGITFASLETEKKEEFLKYEVAVIEFDLDAEDARLKDVFKRLNRTFYSLSSIEKLASEYSASEYLLFARLLNGDFDSPIDPEDAGDAGDSAEWNGTADFAKDPAIGDDTWDWLESHAGGAFSTFLRKADTFTSYEFDRKVSLMFCLNLVTTLLEGYYNRNEKVELHLERSNDRFAERDVILEKLNAAAAFLSRIDLPRMWTKKANLFSLVSEVARQDVGSLDEEAVSARLVAFAEAPAEDYVLAARDSVNGKAQRELRARYIRELLRPAG